MRYFTLDEIAIILNITVDQVFYLTIGEEFDPAKGRRHPGDGSNILFPSANLPSLLVRRRKTVGHQDMAESWDIEEIEEQVEGIFGVRGIRGELLLWNTRGRATVGWLYDDNDPACVIQTVKNSAGAWPTIGRNDLRISSGSLKNYARSSGDQSIIDCLYNYKDANAFIASYRDDINCTRTDCVQCKQNCCRRSLALKMAKHFSLEKVGVAMGMREPKWAKDRDNAEQKIRQKHDVEAIKSQVRRWGKWGTK